MDIDVMLSAAAALRGMRARERWQRSQLDAYRARELAKLRAFAFQRSRFYRDFHAGLAGRPLEELAQAPSGSQQTLPGCRPSPHSAIAPMLSGVVPGCDDVWSPRPPQPWPGRA